MKTSTAVRLENVETAMKKKISLVRLLLGFMLVVNAILWPMMIKDIAKNRAVIVNARHYATKLIVEMTGHPFTYAIIKHHDEGGLHGEQFRVILQRSGDDPSIICPRTWSFPIHEKSPMAAQWLRLQEGDTITFDYNPVGHDSTKNRSELNYLTPRKVATL